MKIGTRSLLFGVHQFLWHPLTVGLAWRRVHKKFPNVWEWIAIFCHDLGYWGCNSMDGTDGKDHPFAGARIAKRVARFFGARDSTVMHVEQLVLGHSRSFCDSNCYKISDLCAPDKLSILYDPLWFYWLRGTLSGEIQEYHAREEERQERKIPSTWAWLNEYRTSVKRKYESNLCPLAVGGCARR